MQSANQYNTLVELIKGLSTYKDRGVHFIESSDHEVFYSYSDIYDKAVNVAWFLQKNGVQLGNELVFQLSDNKKFIICFWACVISGVIPIPLSLGVSNEQKSKIANVWQLLKAPFLITEKASFKKDGFLPVQERIFFFEDAGSDENTSIINSPGEDDIAYVQFSSGSTGNPKGVILTHKNLLYNIRAIHKGIQSPDAGDLFCSWMPLTHDMGLIGFHLTPLLMGWTHYIMPTEVFIRNPNLWLNKISKHRITFTSSPNFGYRYVLKHMDRNKCRNIDLSCLRVIVNGAEPISAELCNEFVEKMKLYGLKQHVIFPVYGLAEASLAVTFSKTGEPVSVIHLEPGSISIGNKIVKSEKRSGGIAVVEVGKAIDYCKVRIAGESNNELDSEFVGYIQIKGENVTKGYYGNETAYNKLISHDGWLNTGDIGFLKKQKLYITGREKDILFVNGYNYYSHDIERCAEAVEGIEMGKIAVAGFFDATQRRDKIIAFVLHRGRIEDFIPTAAALRKHINQCFSFDIDLVIPVKEITKTTSGKIQRYLLLEKYLQNQYAEAEQLLSELAGGMPLTSEMQAPETEVEKILWNIWSEVLGHSRFGVQDKFFEIGGNSLKAAELIASLEGRYKIQIPFRAIFEHQTIAALARLITYTPGSFSAAGHPFTRQKTGALSAGQKRLYYVWEMDKNSVAYNIPVVLKIKGFVSKDKLALAVQQLVGRHELLRCTFVASPELYRQEQHATEPFILNSSTVEAENISHILKALVKPFDLAAGPLFRMQLLQVADDHFFLFMDFHHIIMDGVSISLFVDELFKIYSDQSLPAVMYQFNDYVAWESAEMGSEKYRKQEDIWYAQFRDELPVLNLPSDFSRPPLLQYDGKKIKIDIDAGLVKDLRALSVHNNASLFMVLLSIYNIVLSKFSGQEDIIVGVPVAGRHRQEFMKVIGMFVNNLAIRNYPGGEKTFTEFLTEVSENCFRAFDNQMYEFGQLAASLNRKRDISRNVLFDTMFVYQNMRLPELSGADLSVSRYFFDPGISKYDISFEIYDFGEEIEFYIEYNTALFLKETIRRFARAIVLLVNHVIANPHQKISGLPVVSETEHELFVNKLNDTQSDYPASKSIHRIFEQTAEQFGGRVALIYGDMFMRYDELNYEANKLAAFLIKKGVTTDNVVCILLDRSPELIIAILATLKSGGCFLPVDPGLPPERIAFLLKDCNTKVILTQDSYKNLIGNEWRSGMILMGSLHETDEGGFSNPGREVDIEDLAYVMYTSGTTGVPKGVMIGHRALINYSCWAAKTYFNKEHVRIPLFTSVSFDLTITSIFPPLISGNTIIIYSENDPLSAIEKIMEENRVNVIKLTPSHLKLISANDFFLMKGKKSGIDKIIVGGENLSAQLAKTITAKFDGEIEIYNEYGPTEATVGCMIFKFDPDACCSHSVAIGHPISNTRIYITDKYCCTVPVGVVGEIYISGDGLARGYWNRPELTAQSFPENPFIEGKKMYKTGDLARRLPDGEIEYIGRADHQVKLKGHRIELAEIEIQLKKHVNVKEAIIIPKETAQNEIYLCAYIIPVHKPEFDGNIFRNYLMARLPRYMVPACYLQLDSIPLNKNGKIDIGALPSADREDMRDDDTPRNETESLMLFVWRQVLNVKAIGLNDNFFDLGGDSIKAIQIVSRLYDAGYTLEIKEVLLYQTVAQLVLQVRKNFEKKYEQGIVSGQLGLTPIVNWFFSQRFDNSGHYNQSVLLKFIKNADLDILQQALGMIILHHDGLRINYDDKTGTLFYSPEHVNNRFKIERSSQRLSSSFDIRKDLLIRADLIEQNSSGLYLLITAHHLVIDSVSWGIILEDLYSIYNAMVNSSRPELPFKTASLIDWYKAIGNVPPTELITAKPLTNSTGKELSLRVDTPAGITTILVIEGKKKYNVSCNIILLTALLKAYLQATRTGSALVELESHGRDLDQLNLSRTVGWFTSLYQVSLVLDGDSIARQITSVKEQVRKVYDNMHPSRIDRLSLLPDICFNYLGQFDFHQYEDLFEISDHDSGADVAPGNHATAELEVICQIRNGKLITWFKCREGSNFSAVIAGLRENYINYITSIANYLVQRSEVHFTPSDFKNADISQEELDTLFE
jgi:surfactin family lipopeptide synthetase A